MERYYRKRRTQRTLFVATHQAGLPLQPRVTSWMPSHFGEEKAGMKR